MNVHKAPLVTVYIANHNYGRYLDQAVRSVLAQSMQDFELLVIDDGSTDNSHEIIGKYKDLPQVITIYQKNQGLSITNNIALHAARGKYIMRLDADDFLDENALAILSGSLERNEEVGLVFPDYYVIDESGNLIEVVRRHDFNNVSLPDQPAHGACTMIRKTCLEELGGYDESHQCQDGYELWIRFIRQYKVQNVNLPLFYYRQHMASLTKDETKILQTRSRILENHATQNGRKLSAHAVIPVRGEFADPGSLALRPLAGKPLIEWTIDAALAAKRIGHVIVTTPDPHIIDHLDRIYGNRVFVVKRDKRLALYNTYIEDTILHTLQMVESKFPSPDVITLLYIESPFRRAEQIDNSIDLLEIFETDTVIGVRPERSIMYRHNGNSLEPMANFGKLRLEREEILKAAGQLCVVRRDYLEKHRQIIGGKIGHIIMDPRASVSVTTKWDWEIAEMIARSTTIK
jgi:CMP-N-acetylneuraminic acid synthetase